MKCGVPNGSVQGLLPFNLLGFSGKCDEKTLRHMYAEYTQLHVREWFLENKLLLDEK